MNNRGQSLVLFVLLIPVLLLILYMVYEIGLMVHLKNQIDNINYIAMDFAVSEIEKADIIDLTKELIIVNKNDIDKIDVLILDNKVYIKLEDALDNKIFKNVFKVKSSYVGYIDNNKIVIERAK